MPRIYDVRPAAGERHWPGATRILAHDAGGFEADGEISDRQFGELAKVFRIEFDEDADEGLATVHVLIQSKREKMVRTPDAKGIARASFRCWCKIERIEQADVPIVKSVQ